MLGTSGRVTSNVQRSAFLVLVGLCAHRWGRFTRRSHESAELRRRVAELEKQVAAERRGAAELAAEMAAAQAEFDRTLARVNDLFWTVEIFPTGEMTLNYISSDASGVIGGDARSGLDALAIRNGMSHPDDAEVNAAFTAAMLAGEPAEVEERLIGFDGVTRWTWSRGTPRREGDRLFFDGITTNISERHELAAQREALLEREREQVAMLEEMHRSRDDFIALAGHELRTPLTVIQGYAEHLLDDPSIGPEQRAQLEIVVRRATSMSGLIDDLFDLAKLDAPLATIAFAPVPLDQVVQESVHAHEPMAEQRDITFTTTTDPVHVIGDRARLGRMCDNVIDNAVKFSPPGAEIAVTLTLDGEEAVIAVADHGFGIPHGELPHVFERLYRATNATEGRYPGTGLGLSIALATAEGHGGTALAENGDGDGAVFTIRLPVHNPEDP